LESYVDDNGVGVDDIELIVTDVFPRDMFANGRETVARVSEAITELHQAGLVHRYSTDTDRLLYISWWEEVQRIDKPGKGRKPRPDGTLNYKDSIIRESDESPREPSRTFAPGTGEQGNRGTGEQTSSSEAADAPLRPDVEDLLDYLDQQITATDPEAKLPTRNKKNRDAARLLLDLDNRTPEQVKAAIDFATHDEFWRTNVRSMSKLRDKYDQLRLQAQKKRPHAVPSPAQAEYDHYPRAPRRTA